MRRALTLALALAAIATATASASPLTELDAARLSFRGKDCTVAMPHLTYVLYPEPKLSSREDLFEAYTMLGACDIDTHQPDADAKKEFRKALQLLPDREIDPLFFSSGAVHSYDDVKGELDAQAKRDADERARRDAAEALRQKLANLRLYEHHNPVLTYLPFGIGQFGNDDYYKGGLFAAGELLTVGTSVGIWYYLVNKYGLQSSNVKLEDAQTVRTLQGIEIGTGAAFLVLAITGIVEARHSYKPQVLVPGSEQLLKDLDTEPPKPPKPKPITMHFGPIAVPNGAGIGVSWETP